MRKLGKRACQIRFWVLVSSRLTLLSGGHKSAIAIRWLAGVRKLLQLQNMQPPYSRRGCYDWRRLLPRCVLYMQKLSESDRRIGVRQDKPGILLHEVSQRPSRP